MSDTKLYLQQHWRRAAAILFPLGVLGIIFKNAWLCDDAFITFRTVDNFLNGFGLRWNPLERVQTYTHPLWMMIITVSSAITGELYYTVIALSVCSSAATLFILFREKSSTPLGAITAFVILLSSQSFIDYSTSGLENPLAHLLVAVFLHVHLTTEVQNTRKAVVLVLIAAVAGVNRLDHLVLYLPMVISRCIGLKKRDIAVCLVLGVIPLAMWELFSLFYYGFPFPNTAYAKLNTGIPAGELFDQGIRYFQYTAAHDPVTLLAILIGGTLGFLERRAEHVAVSIGICLYLFYILKIGGDFMAGRFFSLPLVTAVFLIKNGIDARGPLKRRVVAVSIPVLCGAAALFSFSFPVTTSASYQNRSVVNGIADERGYYFKESGLINVIGQRRPFSGDPFYTQAREVRDKALERQRQHRRLVVLSPNIGVFGFYAGPLVHIFDSYALVDPLLARLPAYQTPKWRIGHFRRYAPEGYRDTLRGHRIVIKDESLAEYYRHLKQIIRGDLFDTDRLVTIIKMNLGRYNHLIDWTHYRHLDVAALQKKAAQERKKKALSRKKKEAEK